MSAPSSPLSKPSADHLDSIRTYFDAHPSDSTRASRSYRRLLAHYYNLLIPPNASVLEIGCGDGLLLSYIHAGKKTGVDLSEIQIARARQRIPSGCFYAQAGELLSLDETFDIIIISDTLNYSADAQGLLEHIARVTTPQTRLLLNFHNTLWRPIFKLGEWLHIRKPTPPQSWLSTQDIENLLELSQWEIIKHQPRLLCPIYIPIASTLFNRWIAPFCPYLCLALFTVARLKPNTTSSPLSVSVIIPARNEAGNIEDAVIRTPQMGSFTELIFVEGHSRDATWAEIERVRLAYPDRKITACRQTGKGKGNAVREGYAIAQGDILMILDADLTMPPEELPKFYDAIATGKTEFANGSRLVYPMDKAAMQFLNMIANKFFGLAFSWLLGQTVKDTLCGTKVLRRKDYLTIAANRAYFGDFDPFGDFDLLFGADKQNLKIRDIPIRYRERTYGTTNINRWSHGLLLFKMLAFAARKLKFI
jgi:SAM-dependent methyltransferase